ncbi:MAG: SdrD B-like domain-containing protein [Candidatus Electrothrix sp. GW3-4]|uniref:SdrD B-like domain-containing protein n=1 Tax=Candidatus Electrothrix sp. GW3-4 TaxID=3126740 RepID=UPI0030CB8ECA
MSFSDFLPGHQEWSEAEVTWYTRPNFDENIEGFFVVEGSGYHSANVTALVQDWVNDPDTYPNHGFLLEQGATSYSQYYSSESTEVFKRPKLEISYYTTDPTDITKVVIQRDSDGQDGVADTYVWANLPDDNAGTSRELYTGLVYGYEKQTLLRFDFDTVFIPAAIGDRVWNDTNEDGIQDQDESGISGVTVNLYTCAGTLTESTVSDLDGNYEFTELTPGSYYVEVVTPGGYEFSPQDQSDDELDSDVALASGATACTMLAPGENDLSWDAGLYMPSTSEIGDHVWEDFNKDSIQDDGESGIPGVTVNLYSCQGDNMGTTTTDSNGEYLFNGLDAGDYNVEFILPEGYEFTSQNIGGDDASDSDVDPATGVTECTTLAYSESDLTWDAGLILETPPNCEDCEGKVTELTLQFNGASDALVRVQTKGKGSIVVFEEIVVSGGEFTISGQDKNGTLGTEITLWVNGIENTKIHTSCSQPIGPGLVSGAFEVIAGTSKDGVLCPITTTGDNCRKCKGKVVQLTMQYTGDQDAVIMVKQEGKGGGVVFGPETVLAGGNFEFHGIDKNGTFGAEITLFVDGDQNTKIYTSCSQPIGPGMNSGDFKVVEGYSKDGGSLCPITPTGDECGDCEGKVTLLTLKFNGDDTANIEVKMKDGPTVFSEYVHAGNEFSFSGQDKNGTFGTEITLFVDGDQNTKIHTSCSQPIGPGLVRGSFEVVKAISKEGGLICPVVSSGEDMGECRGKVTRLQLQYLGTEDEESSIKVVMKGKDGSTVFNELVTAGNEFMLSGQDKQGTLGTEITLFVNGAENTKIHTSCSRPIGPGMISGDFKVIDGDSKDGGKLPPL